MKVSIIIITKNQKSFLDKTIPILKNQAFKDSYEIIVVDSGSTDGALEYCKAQKVKIVSISPKDFNYAYALNKGASVATGVYLIRLSGDCVPLGELWLNEIVTSFTDDKVGGVFGKYTISGRKGYGYPDYWPKWRFPKKIVRYSMRPFLFMGAQISHLLIGNPKVFELAGGCCAIRRSIWKNRNFNEKLIAGEDAEYSWYLHLIGYDIVYNPKVESLHEHKINLVKTYKNYFGISWWNIKFKLNIWEYWFKRIIFGDPYKDFRYNGV